MNEKPHTARLTGRTALITGASRGIGAAVARRFAAEGAKLVLAARTTGALEEVDDRIRAETGEAATLVTIDLAQADEIDKLAAAIAERFGRLDILVGNAALLGTLSPMGDIDPATWNAVMGVNLIANWRLIRAFDAALRASDAGRAMFVTSGVARSVIPYWGGYAVSKAALEMMVKIWAVETTKTRMRVNIVDPGTVRTAMRAAAFPGEDPMRLPPPEEVTGIFVDLAESDCTRHGEVATAYRDQWTPRTSPADNP